jgi:hypothetical protein
MYDEHDKFMVIEVNRLSRVIMICKSYEISSKAIKALNEWKKYGWDAIAKCREILGQPTKHYVRDA